MKSKTFHLILFTVLAVCVAVTAALIVYTVIGYRTVSIIHFIAKEFWW